MHIADFARACGSELQPLQKAPAEETDVKQSETVTASLQRPLHELQKKYEIVLSEKTNLEKHNNNLIEHSQSFALILKEEKTEKRMAQEKNEQLQKRVEHFMKKYYLALGLCMVLIVILLFLNVTDFTEMF